jgi:hypothetical protein
MAMRRPLYSSGKEIGNGNAVHLSLVALQQFADPAIVPSLLIDVEKHTELAAVQHDAFAQGLTLGVVAGPQRL